MPGTLGWLVCTAHKTDGTPCKAPVVRGARVCIKHGAAAGHVRAAAYARLERLVDPAISTLREAMLRGDSHSVRLKAAESILDRAGIVAEQKLEVDNQVTIRVSYEDVEMAKHVVDGTIIDQVPMLSNGQNGHQKTAPKGGDENGAEGD